MNANIWLIVILVLVVMSVILAIMDRSFLSPMYLLAPRARGHGGHVR